MKKLDISFTKTCDCSPKHINCLTAKDWVKSQVGIWEFFYEKRDVRDKEIHPAVFPIALPAKCIQLFTHKGELVLDPFAGIGTTLVAAQDLSRNAVGFDLCDKYVDFTKKRLGQKRLVDSQQTAVCDDAHNIPQYLEEGTVSLCVTSPPYAHMLNKPRLNKSMRADKREDKHFMTVQQYSQDPKDLGTMNHDKYAEALTEIYTGIFPLMKKRGHCVININDVWWENKRIPTHVFVIKALEKAGFELRNILIWDKRNLVNGVGIFGWPSNFIKLGATFEYILDFWKP
jgi:DNA modification methylase